MGERTVYIMLPDGVWDELERLGDGDASAGLRKMYDWYMKHKASTSRNRSNPIHLEGGFPWT